jgi:Ca2+-binding EF-hand superfamily protein/uncharacterized protein YkwD
MSTVDKILEEINQCRVNPAKFSIKLSKILRYFKGNIFEKPGYEAIETEEGASNVLACINYLKSVQKVPPLIPSSALSQAAQLHADDIGPSGRMSHIGQDGSEPSDRIEKFGQWSGHLGENIDYGNASPEDIIVSLLIDDGVPARGQRLNLMKREHKYVGIGFGYHAEYQYVCVILFAELVIENSSLLTPSHSSVKKIKKAEYVKVKEITEEDTKMAEMKKKSRVEGMKESLNFNFKDLTDDEVIEIKEFFDKLDRNSGSISITEIKKALDCPGQVTNSSILQVLAKVNTSSKLSLDFDGLLSLVAEKKEERKREIQHSRKPIICNEMILEMKEIFDVIDAGKSEMIKKEDISKALKNRKLENFNSTILDLMKYIDDQQEEMSFEDFVEVISNLKETSLAVSNISNPTLTPYLKPKIPKSNESSYESFSDTKQVKPGPFNAKLYTKPGLSQEQVLEIKKAFDLFDTEKKGLISAQDIKMAMKSQGFKKKNPTVYQIVCELGDEIRGKMDFDDFLYLLTERNVDSVEENDIKKFFDMFDRDCRGYIEIKNLKTIARELGESLDDDDIVDLIRKSDLDGDGKVTYADFYKIMSNAF